MMNTLFAFAFAAYLLAALYYVFYVMLKIGMGWKKSLAYAIITGWLMFPLFLAQRLLLYMMIETTKISKGDKNAQNRRKTETIHASAKIH